MTSLLRFFAPLTIDDGSLAQILSVLIGNLAYFFGLMFGILSILQHFGLV